MKYQALRPQFFSMVGGWVGGSGVGWVGGSVVVGQVMGWVGGWVLVLWVPMTPSIMGGIRYLRAIF